jgi:hypothetical protein
MAVGDDPVPVPLNHRREFLVGFQGPKKGTSYFSMGSGNDKQC